MRSPFKKLDIFMLKQFMLLFAGTFFISLFVLMMQFLWRYVDELIGKGLSLEVLGQFFWYMALMMVPQALPLAILLSSLITMGNLGESSELTAIKAAGISMLKAIRAMIFASVMVAVASMYFQNNIGPDANVQLRQLLLAMKQKSPELEIPEEVFYSGIPNTNLYVQHKDMETGMLYGVMIYRMTQSYDDAAIILADSGRMQSTAEKKHLLLTLYNGEWFENMRSGELSSSANVPYRRESFLQKRILLDFDNGLNVEESAGIAQMAAAQSVPQLIANIDTVHAQGDSIGHDLAVNLRRTVFASRKMLPQDSLASLKRVEKGSMNIDSVYSRLLPQQQREVLQRVNSSVRNTSFDVEMRAAMAQNYNGRERDYRIEIVNKFTLAFTCIIFFFIGASLGAIIKKGGLGVPVIISVVVFIIFYILFNTGTRMAKQASWAIWFGTGLAPAILTPLAVFVTYKANKDSVVFNLDAYRHFFVSLLGMRHKRNVAYKEVIISDPDYAADVESLRNINQLLESYAEAHHLRRLPNPKKVFIDYAPDHEIEHIVEKLESVLEDLSNTRDKFVLSYLAQYPVVSDKAHTRPFDRRWMNIVAGIVVPVGIVVYLRMILFRFRLSRDIRLIMQLNDKMVSHIENKKQQNIDKT